MLYSLLSSGHGSPTIRLQPSRHAVGGRRPVDGQVVFPGGECLASDVNLISFDLCEISRADALIHSAEELFSSGHRRRSTPRAPGSWTSLVKIAPRLVGSLHTLSVLEIHRTMVFDA